MRTTLNEPLLRAFASEVKRRRGELEISQDELAHRAGISRTFLGKIEIAQNQPSLTAIFKIAAGLEVDVGELMSATGRRMKVEVRRG